jgi:Fur family ferric uptake transcriptional regulator
MPPARPISDDARPADLIAACAADGLRMTGQRRVIARVIGEAHDHPDVIELHRRAAAVDERISLSTVYRTVRLLEDKGIIARHGFRDGFARREGRARYEKADGEHHDHLIDIDTGTVIEFRSEEIERLQAEIARKLGYKLIDHRLELYAVAIESKTREPKIREPKTREPKINESKARDPEQS